MKIGVALGASGDVATVAAYVESLGFDHLACGEHVFAPGPTPNAFVQLAAAATATTTIGLVSTVCLLPLYPAPLAAKLAAELDRLSNGRFELGVGAGGEHPAEFTAVGVPVAERFRRLDEGTRVLRMLFSGEETTYAGEFTQLDGVRLSPPPHRPGGPPIWMAGRKPAGIRRVGRLADVWLPYMVTPAQVAEGLALARGEARDEGRVNVPEGGLFVWTSTNHDGRLARRTGVDAVSAVYRQDFSALADRYLLLGSPQEIVARLEEYAAAGVTRVVLQLAADDRGQRRMLRTLAEDVLPAARLL